MELTEDIMEQFVPGCYVRLRPRTESEITQTQGNKINALYQIAGERVGRVISINKASLGQADVVFDHMDHISRVNTRYLEWLHMDYNYSDVAPGDYLTFSDGRNYKVRYLAIRKCILHSGYFVMYICDHDTQCSYVLKESNVVPGERNVIDYEDSIDLVSMGKLLLNSYYGIHTFKDKKPDCCQCEKPIGRGYGFNHGMIYSEPYTIDKNEPDKLHSIDEFDIIKEMQKMKKSTNKPVVNPIKKVISNPPATIVFWKDGSKTVVKAQNAEYDPEKGLAMAIARHYLCDVCGLERYDGVFNRYLPKDKN